ncbi:hypothetical protein DFH06DRAFT_1137059 [Mycena polygramma]|nr:hypothetical protein DFH06DRAFT_1137059 [Mycena polygramma]
MSRSLKRNAPPRDRDRAEKRQRNGPRGDRDRCFNTMRENNSQSDVLSDLFRVKNQRFVTKVHTSSSYSAKLSQVSRPRQNDPSLFSVAGVRFRTDPEPEPNPNRT